MISSIGHSRSGQTRRTLLNRRLGEWWQGIAGGMNDRHLGIGDVFIDSNVVRICGRFFGFRADGETKRKRWLEELAELVTPARSLTCCNYGLVDFTRRSASHDHCAVAAT